MVNEDNFVGGIIMKGKFVKSAVLLSVVAMVSSAVHVIAGTSYEAYSTTVPAFNGSGYTAYQTKTTTGTPANLKSDSVGGSYVVDVRMIDIDGNAGDWTRDVTDNQTYLVDGATSHTSGDSVRLQFSNDWNTPVSVQVEGEWRSN